MRKRTGLKNSLNLLDEFKQRDKSLDPQVMVVKSYEVNNQS